MPSPISGNRLGVDSRADLTSRIGGTPLIPILGIEGVGGRVQVYGKAEWMNPGGSVKDRAAWSIVRAAEADGRLGGGRTLLDATSGNTGIAYAWIGAARGHHVSLCVPGNANIERRRLLAALGAEVVYTDPMAGTDGAILEARRLAAADPDRYFHADQYSNPANVAAHVDGTAPELWEQTKGHITHLVAGIGTSGTLVGTSRGLRRRHPGLITIAVQPDSPLHALEGLKHLASAMVPAIYDASAHQRVIEVASEAAIDMAHAMGRGGILLGWSAGAALVAAAEVARELSHGVVVAILPDSAERYLSESLWDIAR